MRLRQPDYSLRVPVARAPASRAARHSAAVRLGAVSPLPRQEEAFATIDGEHAMMLLRESEGFADWFVSWPEGRGSGEARVLPRFLATVWSLGW